MAERTQKDIRNALTEKTIDILAGYRRGFSGSHPPGQLVLPENLKEFAMYILGLLKSRAFKAGHEPSDRRTHTMRMLKSMGPLELSLFLYPRIIPIHGLSETDGFPNSDTGHLIVPPTIRASFSRVHRSIQLELAGQRKKEDGGGGGGGEGMLEGAMAGMASMVPSWGGGK